MRLAELSERSGVSTTTIKYYLRERLLPPGRRISATQADYGEEHLRRLRLVRALIQVGRMPIATAREVLATVEDESLDQNERLGTAVAALPQGAESGDGAAQDAADAVARRTVDVLLDELGWAGRSEIRTSAAREVLIGAVAALGRLGYPCEVRHLRPYGRAAVDLGRQDLDLLEHYDSVGEQVEAAVALTVLYEPVLLSLRRLAHAAESTQRFGGATEP